MATITVRTILSRIMFLFSTTLLYFRVVHVRTTTAAMTFVRCYHMRLRYFSHRLFNTFFPLKKKNTRYTILPSMRIIYSTILYIYSISKLLLSYCATLLSRRFENQKSPLPVQMFHVNISYLFNKLVVLLIFPCHLLQI